jgi:hypothetical protein
MNARTDRWQRKDGNETLHGLRPIAELMPIVLARRGIDPDLIETPAAENAELSRLAAARAPLMGLIDALATV